MSDNNYALLNKEQKEAVFHTEGPLLILAGAGAGKTRVLAYRAAYLIEEKNVSPWNILMITFTNKAAQEMRERVISLADFGEEVWVATFHSTCVRILRRFIDRLGYETDFTIYDTDDVRALIKQVIRDMNLDPKMYKERVIAAWISSLKNDMITPEQAKKDALGNFRAMKEAEIYEAYVKQCRKNNALDFDDLLLLTVQLLQRNEDVREYYQDRFKYIMVDEYQDTNRVQFEFTALLAKKYGNLCVVGDDDQSIYRFRGADIRNILDFEKTFTGARVIKLEQNYRSTTSILDCANAVISHNRGRKDKHLWSELGTGDSVEFHQYENGYEEASEVIRKIRREVMNGAEYSDFAILYRTNAQSRAFEETCIGNNIPYRLVGGVNFYQRAEIKDLLAYLKTIASGKDDVATERILNVPRRGIGRTTIDRLKVFAQANDLSLMEAIEHAQNVPGIGKALKNLQVFSHMILELRHEDGDMEDLLRAVLQKTDYYSTLEDLEQEKRDQKRENIDELLSKARDFEDSWEEEHPPKLQDFLEEVALVADIDSLDESENRVVLMTLHGSKGLEFPTVFLCGMEDGLFPSYMSLNTGDPMDIEEERRLCYVGITRAKHHLYLSAAKARTLHGEVNYNLVSRFVREIPDDLLGLSRKVEKKYMPPEPRSVYDQAAFEQSVNPKPASFGKSFNITKAAVLPFGVGDRVRHGRFGEGTVTAIDEGKKDWEITIDFDEVGTKRLLNSIARLEPLND
ncbi:MAG: UvrD-helicase domain-containing protein [Lachnospiraceae bacterium]|nr:UvrD-helicase domain-containing protein [Lachnospiraceae bacterium]